MAVLQPPAVALMGPSGTGKTTSVATYVAAGLETFFIGTEPNAVDVVLDRIKKLGLDANLFRYHQLAVTAPGWDSIEESIKLVHVHSYETLTTLKGIAKQNMDHWMGMLRVLKDFPDDRTGQKFGDVTTWGVNRALVIDSLSGLNKMAREYVVGYKPTMHQGEWGVAMQLEENILYKLLADRGCHFALMAHIDREVDEISGASRLTMAALGRKLAPQLIKYFSEVVLAKKENANFYWSTSESNIDVKNRALPIGDKLTPSFVPIVEAHRVRAKDALIAGGASPSATKV